MYISATAPIAVFTVADWGDILHWSKCHEATETSMKLWLTYQLMATLIDTLFTYVSVVKATLVDTIRMYSWGDSFSFLKHQNISNIKEIIAS